MTNQLENLEIDTDTPPALSEKDEAFILSQGDAKTLSFGGRDNGPAKLHAFDSNRQQAAQKLNLVFLGMTAEALEEFKIQETYNGLFADAVIVAYLCTQPLSVSIKALERTGIVKREIAEWSTKNKITIGTRRHSEIIENWGNQIKYIFNSASEVDETGTQAGEGESLGESSETSPSM
ncbi:MAG TPA: hypothetical protein DCG68_03290 [Cryomorphaceae bacterium]|nr:hypothetical protein [Cryomorphaceae bacterium]